MPDRNDTRTPRRDYRALIDGREVQVVGHLHTSPSHPDRGAAITPFEDLAEPGTGAHLFALVSVRGATDDTTVDLDTGVRRNKRSRPDVQFSVATARRRSRGGQWRWVRCPSGCAGA